MSMDEQRLSEIERNLRENYAAALRLDIISDVRALVIEVRALEAQRAVTWRGGPPPMTDPGKPVYVWREGCDAPVSVMYSEGSRHRQHGMYWLPLANRETGRYEPWGTARWAPIPKPDHNPST